MSKISKEKAVEAVRTLIEYLGDDPNRPGVIESPERIIKSFEEIYRGYQLEPKEILKKNFDSDTKNLIVVSGIELYSTCEHHMLPFVGKCHIGYLPDKKIVGVSKLSRLMDVFARRLQIQERLTNQIANSLMEEIKPLGVAVMIEAQHLCMASRGVNKQATKMTTTAMLGQFENNFELKNEFYRLISSNSNQV